MPSPDEPGPDARGSERHALACTSEAVLGAAFGVVSERDSGQAFAGRFAMAAGSAGDGFFMAIRAGPIRLGLTALPQDFMSRPNIFIPTAAIIPRTATLPTPATIRQRTSL